MRFIETGSRDPSQTLGRWLHNTLAHEKPSALRLATGYVSSEPLGYLEQPLNDLAAADGITTILVGSNAGETSHQTLEDIVEIAGSPRPRLHIGVVSFADGLFHPKLYHVTRSDGSMAAYVGSANFTYGGASGKNIEAAMILDSSEGDSSSVLLEIADSIDQWFASTRPGLYSVETRADIQQLVADGVLSAKTARRPATRTTASGASSSAARALKALLRMPAVRKPLSRHSGAPSPHLSTAAPNQPVVPPFVEWWSKDLEASDAQRKAVGNQSGVVALTQADRRGQIDHTTFFRNDLFGGLVWQQAPTRTGHMMDIARVSMHTTIQGTYIGVLDYEVTHDTARESKQRNYTTKLSLGPIRGEFARVDMTGRKMTIGRDAAGEYWLAIA